MKCFFFAQSDSNDKLCKHYPKDLNTDDFVEEIQHLCNMGHSVYIWRNYFYSVAKYIIIVKTLKILVKQVLLPFHFFIRHLLSILLMGGALVTKRVVSYCQRRAR